MSPFKGHNGLEEAIQSKMVDPLSIEEKVAQLRQQGKTLATLNGSFDLLHAGHLHILFEAAKQADLLFILLNTDRSIQEYKSPLRPIIPLLYRFRMMACLEMVDYVTWFDETDPRALLARIKPDVHVNGAEYGADCIEAPVVRAYGGKIHIVELIPELSTSDIISKIIKICV